GEALAGSQQLAGGGMAYFITVSLIPGAANNFVVTATDAVGNESAAANVPSITQDASTPPAPVVTSPDDAVAVNSNTFTVTGTAAAGTLVKVWRDNDGDGVVSAADTVVGSQQLASGATAYSVAVSLTQNAVNLFLVTATNTTNSHQSAATVVPDITQDAV